MIEIHKKIVLDENQKPFAVQIPIEEFERLEEILENYGLSKLMDEVVNDEKLSIENSKNILSGIEDECGKLSIPSVFLKNYLNCLKKYKFKLKPLFLKNY